jgi:dienelactone hydrolase
MKRVLYLPADLDATAWKKEAARIRNHLLERVVFHGWPREWVTSSPVFDEMGTIPSGSGYRMTRFRYEIVPGFYSTAILYAPENPQGKVPAVLNVNGHGQPGKALEYKQKRCINFAKNGIVALNLEWIYFGELRHDENSHWYGGHLDLVGTNAVGLFYLAMRRGLDFLYNHPQVDPQQLGVTGLSGGGWQTIIISALDERVNVSVPVAGYSSLVSRIERPGDIGDIEQNATDLLVGQDFPHLTAMRAPRPTLLIYNNDDDCCFRAPLVKPYIFDAVQPFFELMGAGDAFDWHENLDPGDHNYQLDNRIQAYRFFTKHFGLPVSEAEIPVDGEIKDPEELNVGIPESNLTILGLARQLAKNLERIDETGDLARTELRELIRYRQVDLEHAWAVNNSKKAGIESETYRFEFSDQLSATGVWLKATTSGGSAPATIILSDLGKKESSADVSERINRGEQVLVIDLLFRGDASPSNPSGYTQLLATTGDRSLGIQTSHLMALTEWVLQRSGNSQARIETRGMRSQVTAQLAAALYPSVFSELAIKEGIASLGYLLDAPIQYDQAPDLFCLDLFAQFDIDILAQLAETTVVELKTLVDGEVE